MSAMTKTEAEGEAAPMPQYMLYRMTVERTTVERREYIVYAGSEYDAQLYAEENEVYGGGMSDFVLYDSEWEECDVSDEREVETLPHELKDYAPEIAALNLDARIAAEEAAECEELAAEGWRDGAL